MIFLIACGLHFQSALQGGGDLETKGNYCPIVLRCISSAAATQSLFVRLP